MRLVWRASISCVLVSCAAVRAAAQTPQTTMTWAEIRHRFRAPNPTLPAGRMGMDESKAAETTACLRPNPQWSVTRAQVGNVDEATPFSAANLLTSISYLHERRQKRELRRDSAERAPAIATSAEADLERN